MAGKGWSLPRATDARPAWVWSDAPESVLWLALAPDQESDGKLELVVRAPAFLSEPASLQVELNGVDLGSVPLDSKEQHLDLPLPSGLELGPMNRLVLRGSNAKSPKELGVGDDSRRLRFSFRSASLAEPGEPLRVRRLAPPRGAFLDAGAGTAITAVDLSTRKVLLSGIRVAGRVPLQATAPGGELALIASPASHATLGAEPGYLNVVLIVIDTLRADAIARVPTPHIDSLAEAGVAFGRAFAHAPMTLPSHATLFSGRLPSTTGVVNNGQDVPGGLPLLPQRLAAQGYSTFGVISIETLWPRTPESGLDRGS
jgi:hypothetical protein